MYTPYVKSYDPNPKQDKRKRYLC